MTIRTFIITVLCLSIVQIAASAAEDAGFFVQRDMLSLIENEKGSITVDTIDIGKPEELFDGDRSTLVRSKSVNPFTATLVLDKQMKFDRTTLILIPDEEHEWTLEIAANEKDLESRRRTYERIVDKRHVDREIDELVFDSEHKARAFRLTIHRLTGDDYVHIHEWEFPVEQKLKDLEVMVLNYFPREKELKPAEWLFQNTVMTLRAWAVPESGPKLEVTNDVKWVVSRGQPWMDTPGRFHIEKPGPLDITAKYLGSETTASIDVIEYKDFKGEKPVVDFTNNHDDIDVLFIERLPKIDYDGPNGGWPEESSTVTWRAHVYNWGKTEYDKVTCQFLFDRKVVWEGIIEDFEPNTFRTVDWEWKWEKRRHRVAFEVDMDNGIEEFSEANNRVEDFTDALSLGCYVEEYEWLVLHEHQPGYGRGSNSWADYIQGQVWFWNDIHENAIHPSTRQGVTDRIRVDKVHIVPNNSLPMAGGLPSNNPNNNDKTVDLIWGFEARDCYHEDRWRFTDLDRHTFRNRVMMHELNHARYIIDLYGLDVPHEAIHVLLDDGTPLAKNKDFFPSWLAHFNKYRGLMGGGIPPTYDEYVALLWNRIAGQRARGGNYNSPEVIGEYLQEHPEKNTFTFVDKEGTPLVNAGIWIYRTVGSGKAWYDKTFDNVVDLKFTLDDRGMVDLPWTIFSDDGTIVHTFGKANGIVLVRVNDRDRIGFEFIEVSGFNVEYMRGHTAHGHYTVTVSNMREKPGKQ